MTLKNKSEIDAEITVIQTETKPGGNTKERIAQVLDDITDYAESMSGGTSGSSSLIIDTTYNNLVSLISSSSLIVGSQYRITDYQTIHYMLDGTNRLSDINSGSTEALLVTAATTNTLFTEAKSEAYPQDIIYYDWNPANWLTDNGFSDGTTIISGYKGTIYRRIDTVLNNDVPFDFRNVKFRRWKYNYSQYSSSTTYNLKQYVYNIGDGIYVSLQNSNSGNELSSSNYWIKVIDFSITEYWAYRSALANDPTDYLDSYMFSNYDNKSNYKNIFESYDKTYTLVNSILNNTIFYGITNVNTFGSNFEMNTFGNNNFANIFGNNNSCITLGSFNYNNVFKYYNSLITFGNSNSTISIGAYNASILIGNNNSVIRFGNNNSAVLGNYNSRITFGDYNSANVFGNWGNYVIFENSIMFVNFSNIIISTSHFKSGYNGFGIDFSLATHIIAGYECEIFKASDNNYYLKYFNGTSEQYVAPNS